MNQPNKERFKTSVGGQALMEGIMMRGPKNICCAVRKPDGTIETKVEPTPAHGVWTKIPLVHPVELIDWATGGPKPDGIAGRGLEAPARGEGDETARAVGES